MNSPALRLFVRQLPLLLALALPLAGTRAADFPPAPRNHIYDPDFLISQRASAQMSQSFTEFQASDGVAIYLAVFTNPPDPISETAIKLNQAWNQSSYGVIIAFSPGQQEVRVVPSPQLSLAENADHLTGIFRAAARPALARGDYSGAASDGTKALIKRLHEVRQELESPGEKGWQLTQGWALTILAILLVAGAIFLFIAARIWRSANLFDRRYAFPKPDEPVAKRFGGARCGGQMATIRFGENQEARQAKL
ncbi:MAG: TPM domain-containing protein [Chthoniobacterales bacterium]